jgi:hypothetical protein
LASRVKEHTIPDLETTITARATGALGRALRAIRGAMRRLGPALALALAAPAAGAAPGIVVTPSELDVPVVTIGDTAYARIEIANRGDQTLIVSALDLPEGVRFSVPLPHILAPDSLLKANVEIAPIDTATRIRSLSIHSNDPTQDSVVTVTWPNRALPLVVTTLAIGLDDPYPLGEPIVVESVPMDGVRIEKMTLYYRNGLSGLFNPIDMTRNIRAWIGIIEGGLVLEGKIDYYVEMENSGFTATDPPEADARPFRLDISSPFQFDFDAVARDPGLTFRVGENIDFMMGLGRGTIFDSGSLYFRSGGDSLYDRVDILEISFTGISASIPGTAVAASGVEYFAEINTRTTRLTDPANDPVLEPIEIRVRVENLAEPSVHPAERYRLFSTPYEPPQGTTLSAILSDHQEFGSYDPVRWRAFRYLPELGANVELSAATGHEFDLAPGRAFWLISRSEHRIDTAPAPGTSTKLSEPFRMILPPGWNAIGNPFDFPIRWATAVRKPATIGDPIAFDPATNDYVEASPAEILPFEGYFVENSSAVDETLFIQPRKRPVRGPGVVAARVAAPSPISGWRVEARAAGGVDGANVIGVASDAADQRDAQDAAEPPPPPEARVRLAIANREWPAHAGLYRRDIRAPGPGHAWELELTSATAGEPIAITIRPEGTPPGETVWLLDREQGSVVELAPQADGARTHRVLSLGASRPYRVTLLAGAEDWVRRASRGEAAPALLTLDRVAPNPARGAVRLRFGLPRPAAVRLEVFDVTGQRIATLLEGAVKPAGFHSVVWEGTRQKGGRLTGGVYYYRLSAGSEVRSVRAVLIP